MWQGLIKNRRKDGGDFYIETTIAPILNKKDEITEFISIETDVADLILNKKQLQRQLVTDRLTGLPNRVKLQEDLKKINLFFGVKLGDEASLYMADTISKLIASMNGASLYRTSADYSGKFEEFAYTLNSYIVSPEKPK